MANMSYCRFENTYHDLRDCYNALTNGEGKDKNMNKEYEQPSKKALIKLCQTIVEEFSNGEENEIETEEE
jgi:hypothetical protein